MNTENLVNSILNENYVYYSKNSPKNQFSKLRRIIPSFNQLKFQIYQDNSLFQNHYNPKKCRSFNTCCGILNRNDFTNIKTK